MFRIFILFVMLTLSGGAQADTGPDMQKALSSLAQANLSSTTKDELNTFYALRGYHAAWNLSDETSIKKMLAFSDSIEGVITYHGLGEENYPIEAMRKLASSSESDKQNLEILITSSLLRLGHDLHGDSIDLGSLYTGWNFHRDDLDVPTALNNAINAGKLGDFFDHLSPQSQAYRDLAKALQDYRAIEAKGGWPAFGSGRILRLHDSDPRIARLRARLTAEGYSVSPVPEGAENVFDEALSKTLMTYQTRNGLSPDGHLGGKTQEALDLPVASRLAQIRANMERWRHMPESFPPDRYVEINIPDFSVSLVEDGKEIYRGSVIVGRTDRQTPFIDSKIVNMLINPSWHVPISIARKDILPKLRHDPHYLEKLGIVIAGRDSDPSGSTIDWRSITPEMFHYTLRQLPSDVNSLGQLKFNFANAFSVYMHGTPHQELFDKAERDFSSGCVRLEDPIEVGELLLASNKDAKGAWSQQRIQSEIDAGATRFVSLAKPIPITFLYWSVFMGTDGAVNFRKDIYGYDSALMNKIKDQTY